VTHDQKEALSVGDRIAILKDGVLQQVGTPSELYHKPQSSFVADFIGHTNLLSGRIVDRSGGMLKVETRAGTIHANANGDLPDKVIVSIRPEQMRVVRTSAASVGMPNANRLVGRTVETTFLGEASEHVLDVQGERVKVISAPPLFDVPAEMAVEFGPGDVVVLPE
jgi:ABC-type Fe3+/spermidine/putrescine transport system ATPase subunit